MVDLEQLQRISARVRELDPCDGDAVIDQACEEIERLRDRKKFGRAVGEAIEDWSEKHDLDLSPLLTKELVDRIYWKVFERPTAQKTSPPKLE